MKLNYKRTVLVGMAFLSICAFWQVYDAVIPLILRDTFALPDGAAGIVMSLDNVVTLFLLPLFGALSDRAKWRKPFIVGGTLLACVLLCVLGMLDHVYGVHLTGNTGKWLFFVALVLLVLTMAMYRSPAVALMADVTPKPLRSKGNAVINLMGALGGLYTLVMVKVLVAPAPEGGRSDYFPLFLSVALLMVVAIVLLIFTVQERRLVQEMVAINYGVSEEEDQGKLTEVNGKQTLPKAAKRSLLLILGCITLWFLGYNAITTAFSKYATQMWQSGLSHASTCLMVATVAAVVSYLPIGMLSARIGRKRTILVGLVMATLCLVYGSFFAHEFSAALYVMFAVFGFAQAAVTVNTFPMVWELSHFGNVGKYTGYYYTCSMAAQVVTPLVSGYLLQYVGYQTLFPYGAVLVALAMVPMFFTRHGDSRPARKSTLETLGEDGV